MCVSGCKMLYNPNVPLEEITCPCGKGYWDIFVERFVTGEEIRRGKAPSRERYEAQVKEEMSTDEYVAIIRRQWIKHFLDCETKEEMDRAATLQGTNDGSTLRRAERELEEISRGDYRSRGRSQMPTGYEPRTRIGLDTPQTSRSSPHFCQGEHVHSNVMTIPGISSPPSYRGDVGRPPPPRFSQGEHIHSNIMTTPGISSPPSYRGDVGRPPPPHFSQGEHVHSNVMTTPGISSPPSYRGDVGRPPPPRFSQGEHIHSNVMTTPGISSPPSYRGDVGRPPSSALFSRSSAAEISHTSLQRDAQFDDKPGRNRPDTMNMFLPGEGISWDILKHHQEKKTFGQWISIRRDVHNGRQGYLIEAAEPFRLTSDHISKLMEESQRYEVGVKTRVQSDRDEHADDHQTATRRRQQSVRAAKYDPEDLSRDMSNVKVDDDPDSAHIRRRREPTEAETRRRNVTNQTQRHDARRRSNRGDGDGDGYDNNDDRSRISDRYHARR